MSLKPIAISASDAYQMCQQSKHTFLIDIRASMEYLFIGHPLDAVHIAWMEEPDWDIRTEFKSDIQKFIAGVEKIKQTNETIKIILICRSGNRSEMAGEQLLVAGLKHIYHVRSGFEGDKDQNNHRSTLNGWRFRQLPWEQC